MWCARFLWNFAPEQTEHANYENINWNWWPLTQYYKSVKFGPKTEMCSDFYEIWHLEQIKHANYEYCAWNWGSWLKVIDLGKSGLNTEIYSSFHEMWHSGHIWYDLDPKKEILENFVPNLKCAQYWWILTLRTN